MRVARISDTDLQQLDEAPVGIRRAAALFKGHFWATLLVSVIIAASALISLAQPFLLRAVIDDALPHGNTTLLVKLVVGMVVVAILTGILGVWQTWLATKVGQQVMHDLRTKVFSHVQSLSIDFFKRTRSGEIQDRITQDIAGLQSVITTTATSIASNLTTAIATAAAMVALSWQLSLLTLLVLPPALWGTRRVALVRRDITSTKQRVLADLYSQVEESLSVSGAQLSKTLGAAARSEAKYVEISEQLIGLELRSQLAGRWRMATMQTVFAVIPALIYLAAGFPGAAGDVSIGTLIAFSTLQAAIFRPIMGLLNIGAQWVSSMALLSRIFGYLDLPVDVPEPADPVRLPPGRVRGEVRLEGVRYRFPDGDVDALADIDLVIPSGRSVAVVGETGSGKSTLASLLVRLADPTEGRITLDGVDLRRLSSSDRAFAIGMVTQETYLRHASIAENLRLAKPTAGTDELWRALEAAQVAEVVRVLPFGLDTMVGSRGHRFSGGERQRLAIARTLLANPPVLVLDEATSALDTETERDVQAALDHLMKGRTTITIAHRLSTIRAADEIVVLEAGRVVERGTHDGLMARKGRYASMVDPLDAELEELVGRRFLGDELAESR
ncbi:MAG: ABC transporter ATP-binding protein [Propionicimonas sp.]